MELNGVEVRKKVDQSFEALHVASGRVAHGLTQEEALAAMKDLLALGDEQELTSQQFSGLGKEIAEFVEGPVSDMLALHSGFARLVAYHDGMAHIKLGGGCQGCPSSTLTLLGYVRQALQEEFGEEKLIDVVPEVD